MTKTSTGVTIGTIDLPPHQSAYYAPTDPNYVAFDTHGGTYHKNPNTLSQQAITVKVPDAPVWGGVTITSDYVDGKAGTNSLEYKLGAIGVALDGVALYSGTAAPGDDIAQEAYTFDAYAAHPDPSGSYHYHAPTPGPLEVTTAVGEDGVELYGILCDGTLVLGCNELDKSAPSGSLDAQGGHVGDIKAADGTLFFTARYHVHVCASGHGFTPEVHYYGACQ